MLVLSRKKNESIVINNDITIVVVEIRGDELEGGALTVGLRGPSLSVAIPHDVDRLINCLGLGVLVDFVTWNNHFKVQK